MRTAGNKAGAPSVIRDFWFRLSFAREAQRFRTHRHHRSRPISRREFPELYLKQNSSPLQRRQLPLCGIVVPLADGPAAR